MRVLMLVDSVYEDAVGGSRVVARELALRLTERGHAVTFVAPEGGRGPGRRDLTPLAPLPYFVRSAHREGEEAPRDRGTHSPFPCREGGRGVRSGSEPIASAASYSIVRFPHQGPLHLVARAAQTVHRVAAEFAADLLHVHFAYPAVGLAVRPVPGLPVVRSYYGSWALEASEQHGASRRSAGTRLRERVERMSLRQARRVIVLSRFSRDEAIREYQVPEERIDLVPGGVDLARFRPGARVAARRGLGLPEGRPLLLTIRRLVPRMGLDALLDALVAVRREAPEVLLVVGGTGPMAAELRERVDRNGVGEAVRFVGFIPDEDLATYYQAADLFVLPTRALEGFGLPTVEAFACGIPVVGTPVGATPELLREIDADLVLPGASADAIAAGVIAFLRDPARPSWAPERLRAFAESRFSWDAVADGTLAVYRRALEGDR